MTLRISLILAATLALAACNADPVVKADAQTVAGDSTATDSTTAAGATTAAAATPAPDSAAAGDTTRPAPIPIRLVAGRGLRDSISLRTAIRLAERTNWPAGPAALPGSILPNRRIVAYYGNPLSKRMGALGEYPVDEMLARLDREVAAWNRADPSTPVQPALHLIAVVAQGAPGRDGKYRLRMDSTLIEQVYGWAQRRNAILFLDIQTGQSTIQEELPRLLRFLQRPNVHLGIDPEFNMHHTREGVVPGRKIGTLSAEEINYASRTLSELVQRHNLPPKVLVVHRFTRNMVQNASQIRLDPRVQVVMHMDGWGAAWLKFDSYRDYIVREPVQFTGFKLFYHNDTKRGDPLLTPAELLQLKPRPLYIQYQ